MPGVKPSRSQFGLESPMIEFYNKQGGAHWRWTVPECRPRPVSVLFVPVLATASLVLILLSGCSKENPPVPWADHLALARSVGTEIWGDHILLEEESGVTVGTYMYSENKPVDIFYPPEMDSSASLPVLILVGLPDVANRREAGKPYRYMGVPLGWAQLAAEEGFAVAIAETGNAPKNDTIALVEWIRTTGDSLNMDGDRIGMMSTSDAAYDALKTIRPEKDGIPYPSILFAVFYYATIYPLSGLDTNTAYFVVTVDGDNWADNDAAQSFAEEMRDQGADVTFEVHESGMHGFDTASDNERSRELISQTLNFMKEKAGL